MFDPSFSAITSSPSDVLERSSAQPHADHNWASVKFIDLAPLLGATVPAEHNLVDISFPVRRIKPGETLYRVGDRFNAIYVVR